MRFTQPTHLRFIFPPVAVGLAWVVCIGVLDWVTGPELALSAFYLPGISLVAWYSSRGQTLAVAFCAALAWLFAELSFQLDYSSPFIPYWNAGIRLSFFVITALLTFEVRSRQRTEKTLREQDSILRSILDSMGDGVVVVAGDGTIIAFNPAASKLFGENPIGSKAIKWAIEIENRLIEAPSPVAQRPSFLRLAVDSQLPGYHELILSGSHEGGARVLGLTSQPLLGSHVATCGVVMVFADLTARRSVEKRIAEASEREQRRIGQDLHDGVCQHLVGVAFAAGSLQNNLESRFLDSEAAAAGEIASLINDAIREARNLAHGLYPAGLEEGIEFALRTLASTTQERAGVVSTANIIIGNVKIDPISAVHLYRIAQECVSNACRHGAAKTITISLKNQGGLLKLTVADDGNGIDNARSGKSGIGLNLMHHRAALMGGNLEIESYTGHGTRVVCNLPATIALPPSAA